MILASATAAIGAYTAGTMIGENLFVAALASGDVSILIGIGIWLVFGGVALVLAGATMMFLTRENGPGDAPTLE
jgi:hypothetical protein